MGRHVLCINPGSTSTKIAVFEDDGEIFNEALRHTPGELADFPTINDQLGFRQRVIEGAVAAHGLALADMDAFSARGGSLQTLESGTFAVNEDMVCDAREGRSAKHPANLGVQIAERFTQVTGKPAFMVNGPTTDEMDEVARFTGIKGIYRTSNSHALNQKEVARRYAETVGRPYEDLRLVVCHIGGGISVTAHRFGRMVDTTDNINGDGPMAPNRAGAIPAKDMVDLCFSGISKDEALALVRSCGGLMSHLGTYDVLEVTKRVASGDVYAKKVYDAMIYQIAKAVGAMAVACRGPVDQVILTGGIAHDEYLAGRVRELTACVAPVTVMAGEFEMEGLAAGALDALERGAKEYTGVPVWSESMLYDEVGLREA